MLGPQTSKSRGRHRTARGDDVRRASDYTDTLHRECELCESVKIVRKKYDMRVCPTCDERLLP